MTTRITRAILLVTGLVVAGLGIPLAILVQASYEDRAVIDLQRRAAETVAEISLPLDEEDVARAAAESDAPGPFSVYDPEGRRLYGDGPVEADGAVLPALQGEPASEHTHDDLVVAVPITERTSEAVVGALRVTQPASVVAADARRAWLLMLGAVAVAFVVAVVVARRQARRLAEPIARLADQAVGLGRGDFTRRHEPSGIAEVDTVASALDDSAAQLTELLARERSFSADVSHQLRTPLAGLRLRLERAVRDQDLTAVDNGLAEVDRLSATVEHLLALARDAQPLATPLAVASLLAPLEERWGPRANAVGRRIAVRSDDDLPLVRASAVAAGQVLDVLVDNAVRHGGGTVDVHARAAFGGVVIEVRDEGAGIADEDLDRVFARHQGSGSGIGLALARTITEADGGRLVVAEGRPPRFQLVLPAADGTEESAQA